MSAAKSTPTPWLVFEENEIIEIQAGKDGQPIVFWLGFDRSDVPLATRRANAHRIVQCVNAHDDLVEALLGCIAVIERTAHCTEADRLAAADMARAAIAKAGSAALAKAGSDGVPSVVEATKARGTE